MTEGPRKKKTTSTARAGSRKGSRLARTQPPSLTPAPEPPSDTKAASSSEDRLRRIRERAYLLYVESGYQHGHDVEHWLEAERQLADSGTGREQEERTDPTDPT